MYRIAKVTISKILKNFSKNKQNLFFLLLSTPRHISPLLNLHPHHHLQSIYIRIQENDMNLISITSHQWTILRFQPFSSAAENAPRLNRGIGGTQSKSYLTMKSKLT